MTLPEIVPQDALTIRYIALSTVAQWDRNPKKHDAGAIATSIANHGFKDPPKFEPTLNGGEGGVVEGNGRIGVLMQMRDQGQPLPRGLAQDDAGEWYVPILFGVDAPSREAAESYAIDHNNLVLAGGDFTALDMARLWNAEEYNAILADLAHMSALPVTVDGDSLDMLLKVLPTDVEFKEYDESVAGEVQYHECPQCGHKWPK